MIYLVLAILCSTCISTLMRTFDHKIKNEMAMFMMNYAVCIFFSYLMMNKSETGSSFLLTVFLGIVSGILYLASFIALKVNIKYNGIILASTFTKLGVIIPIIMAIVFFNEIPKGIQMIGIMIAVVSIIMIQYDKSSLQKDHKKILLLIVLFISGITDSMANIFNQLTHSSNQDFYLVITFCFAFLSAFFLFIVKHKKYNKLDFLYGGIIGIPNYFSSRFLLLALSQMDAIIVYPIYSVATLICISMVGLFVFKEELSFRKIIALLLIIVALFLLNM